MVFSVTSMCLSETDVESVLDCIHVTFSLCAVIGCGKEKCLLAWIIKLRQK